MRQERYTAKTLESLAKKFPAESAENREQRSHKAKLQMKLFTDPEKSAKDFEEGDRATAKTKKKFRGLKRLNGEF